MATNRQGEFYVQTVAVRLQVDGQERVRSFMGIAFCSPEEWDQIKKGKLGEQMKSIGFGDPEMVDKLLADNPDNESLHNVVDLIRNEARGLHDDLS